MIVNCKESFIQSNYYVFHEIKYIEKAAIELQMHVQLFTLFQPVFHFFHLL